jgi:sigma-B regulation protein RsbU (phosphoserine phosphatase)
VIRVDDSSRPSFEREIADLRTILELTRDLAASHEMIPLLQRIEAASLSVLDCERATVFLYDTARHELYSKVATGVEAIRFSADLGISGEAVRSRETINVPSAYADPRFNPEVDRRTGFRTRNMLTFPLLGHEGEMMGVLQVLNKRDGGFTSYDERLASTLSAQAGVIIQRQLLLDAFALKKRLERDLDIARDIQRQLLPRESPQVPGFDVAGWNQPADQTGGDYYDFFPLANGFLTLTVADASGHGIGPALVAAQSRALLRASARFETSGRKSVPDFEETASKELTTLLARVNELLCEDLPDERFVTVFFGVLVPERASLFYVSAGHGPILHYSAATSAATGLPLGMLGDATYALGDLVTFSPGDILLVMTDGFSEWARPDGQMFGVDRIKELIASNAGLSSAELIARLHDDVTTFSDGSPQADDLTAVAVRRL